MQHQILTFLLYKQGTLIPTITFTISSLGTEASFIAFYSKLFHSNFKRCKFYSRHLLAGGRFEVDERSGVVRTKGNEPFQLDMEYVLYVKAEDQNGRIDERRFQSTPEERLSIVGGKRAPQFYLTAYDTEIPENKKKDSE